MKRQYPPRCKVFVEGKQIPRSHVKLVELDDGLEMLDELIVVLRNPNRTYTKGRNKLRGCKIRLEAGRIGKEWDTMFTGRIASPLKRFSEEGDEIEIKALPVDITEGWHVERHIYYRDYNRFSDVIVGVVQNFHRNYKMDIEQSESVGIILPIQQGETDIQFCTRLALEAGGYEFAIKGETVLFRKSKPTERSVYTFEYKKNVSSIEEQESDENAASAVEAMAETGTNSIELGAQTASIDTTRKQSDKKADDVERGPYAYGDKPIESIYKPFVDPSQAQKEAEGVAKRPATQERKLVVKAPGSIKVRAGKTCMVKGYDDLDGKYYIQPNVKFVWSRSEPLKMTAYLSNRQAEEKE